MEHIYYVKDTKSLLIRSDCTVLVYSDTYSDIVDEMQLDGITLLNMKDLSDCLKSGYESIETGNRSFIDKDIKPDDLAAIIFTSGTTGVGEGVMPTHLNIASAAAVKVVLWRIIMYNKQSAYHDHSLNREEPP